jgi:hypothetical protein
VRVGARTGQRCVATKRAQLDSIDLLCLLPASWGGRIGSRQRRRWRVNVDPVGRRVVLLEATPSPYARAVRSGLPGSSGAPPEGRSGRTSLRRHAAHEPCG